MLGEYCDEVVVKDKGMFRVSLSSAHQAYM